MHATIVLDDVPFDVWLRRVEDRVEVEVEGEVFRFRGALDGNEAVLHPEGAGAPVRVAAPEVGVLRLDGQALRVRVPRFEPGGGPGAHATGHGLGGPVRTPMPGKVVAVHGAEGKPVRQGDVVVVLEAMKMQVKVPSPCDGLVDKLHVRPGDTVDAAAVLFHVTPAPVPQG